MRAMLSATIALAAAARAGAAGSPALPNILFIVMDDLGHDDMGFAAVTPQLKTPNVDRFAKAGRELKNYYVQPSCSPTRTTFLSGRYPLHTGIDSYIPTGVPVGLNLNETTMADVLTGAGYASHAIGKWHLGNAHWGHTPTFRGFQSFLGFYGGGEDYYTHISANAYDLRRDRGANCGPGCSEVATDLDGQYSTLFFSAAAVRVVEEHDTAKPLFLYLAYQAVHSPAESPDSYQAPYKKMGLTGTRLKYAGMIAAADEGIGNVTAAMEAKGMLENTFMFFSTDNGGPTETCAIQGSSNWPFRGSKCSIWEGGTHGVAFVWSGRGDIAAGVDFNDLMHAADLLPTLADMVGAKCPQCKPWDGVSQWARLTASEDEAEGVPKARDHVYYGRTDFQVGFHGPAVRDECHKLIIGDGGKPGGWHPPPNTTSLFAELDERIRLERLLEDGLATIPPFPPNPNNTHLLFDLCNDPGEHHPLDVTTPENAAILASLLKEATARWATSVPGCDTKDAPSCPGYVTGCPGGKPVNRSGRMIWEPWCPM